MIDLYYVGSPNVVKIIVGLEEMELPYTLKPVDLSKGEHHDPRKVGGGATGKLPVIVDHDPVDGGEPFSAFESGAILQYLAEKTGKFLPSGWRERSEVMQWLFWQMGGLGPIGGQVWHFHAFAPLLAPDFDNSYSYNRYFHMYSALWKTMNRQLEGRDFLCGDYSIADMACYPWIAYIEPLDSIEAYPNVLRWRDRLAARPAVQRAYHAHLNVDIGYERTDKGAPIMPWDGVVKHVIVT